MKAKSSAKKRPAAASNEAQKLSVPGAEPAATEPDSPADAAASKPSASAAKGRGRGKGPMKRPAGRSVVPTSASASQKAYKYCYHKEQKWGIKFKGHEVMTVGYLASQFASWL